jgi:hypothetical protein
MLWRRNVAPTSDRASHHRPAGPRPDQSGVFSSGASDTAAFLPELTLTLVSVPEPAGFVLMTSGLLDLAIYARRRRASARTGSPSRE